MLLGLLLLFLVVVGIAFEGVASVPCGIANGGECDHRERDDDEPSKLLRPRGDDPHRVRKKRKDVCQRVLAAVHHATLRLRNVFLVII